MATLLKRSDAALYRIYVGTDPAAFVAQLTSEHCFDVHMILHAPVTVQTEVTWFRASMEQAIAAFVNILPARTEYEGRVGHVAEPVVEPEVSEVEGSIWDHLVMCPTRDATKAKEVRDVLIQKLGKRSADHLLSNTKPSVAQDASGKKNRVLKLGGSYLKLKGA
jgi:hypothetical protein